MARLAVSLAGAAIGNMIAPGIGGQIGYAMGSVLGGLLFSESTNTDGPRIEDAQVTTSGYGQIVPIVYGIYPVGGNIIDASPVREVKTEEDQGKGGPSSTVTTFTYFGDLDVEICRGPIAALLQIRMNGKIIFDASPGATVVRPSWLKFTLYKGTANQQTDPTFEALHGVGNLSAYRGTAHIVIEDFPYAQSGNSFAPAFEFLVAVSATGGAVLQDTAISVGSETSGYGGGVIEPTTGLIVFPIRGAASYTYSVAAVDPYTRNIVWRTPNDGEYSGWYLPIAVPGEVYFMVADAGVANYIARVDAVSGAVIGYSSAKTTGSANIIAAAVDWNNGSALADVFIIKNRGAFNGHDLIKGFNESTVVGPPDGWYISSTMISDGAGKLLVAVADSESSPTNIGVAILDTAFLTWSQVLVTGGISSGTRGDDTWFIQTGNDTIKEISDTPDLVRTIDLSADYSITDVIQNGSSSNVMDGLVYDAAANDLLFQSSTKFYRLNLDEPSNAPQTTAVAGSTLTLYHAETCRVWYGPQSSINVRSANLCAVTGAAATLDAVVSDIATNGTNLSAADIDVTALALIPVSGFCIARPMARRNALAMLMAAYMFDFVFRNGKLTAVLRGGASSFTLTEDHIGAFVRGSEPQDPWRITTRDPSGLPDRVEVTFIDPDHNYEPGAQGANRQASTVGRTRRIDLALVLTNDEAAQVADTYLHLLHIESEQYETTVVPSAIDDVVPAAVLTTEFKGESYVFRAVKASVIEGRRIALTGMREVPEVFASYAVGGVPRGTNSQVAALGLTMLYPLDIPMLRAQDDNAGIYVAGASFTPGWPGAEVQRSADGVSFSPISSITYAGAIGSAMNAPATGQANSLDIETTLNISLMSGALFSSTRDSPTYAAWGVNGRFEIIAFITATQHADGYWQVSDMVRGVLDTGHAVSSHRIGDQFVVLDPSTLDRVIFATSSIGQVEHLRGVTFGRTADSAIPVQFTFTAESLEPFAPCRLHAEQDGSDNWDLSWSRQDRTPGRALWSPANSESIETYILEILDETGEVIRTETVVDDTTYEYTTAQQAEDFGGNQDYLRWRVCQVSVNTGRGHVAESESGTSYNYVSATVGKSPSLYVRFEETSGIVAEALVGSIDGEYKGSPTLGSDGILPTGKAMVLDGSSDYVEFIPYDAGFSNTWVKCVEICFNITNLPASGHDAIVVHTSTAGVFAGFYLLVGADQKLRFVAHRSGGLQAIDLAGAATITTGTNYHLIVNFDYGSGANVDMYLNGATYASGTTVLSWDINVSETYGRLWVGHSSVGGYGKFDGKVDDLVMYSTNLDSTQRADQFARGGIA